jgi:hypothetical protein
MVTNTTFGVFDFMREQGQKKWPESNDYLYLPTQDSYCELLSNSGM